MLYIPLIYLNSLLGNAEGANARVYAKKSNTDNLFNILYIIFKCVGLFSSLNGKYFYFLLDLSTLRKRPAIQAASAVYTLNIGFFIDIRVSEQNVIQVGVGE